MANGKIRFGKQSGGQLALVIPDGVANTEVIVPESGTLVSVGTTVTDNAIVRFDGTTGAVQNSGVIIDDSGNVGIGGETTTNGLIVGNLGGTDGHISLRRASDGVQVGSLAVDITNSKITLHSDYGTLSLSTGSTEKMRIDSVGNVLLTSGTGALGYGAGAGGIVTQLTSKTAIVTLNKPSGTITMNNSALAAGALVTMPVNNSTKGTSDTVLVSIIAGVSSEKSYNVWCYPSMSNGVFFVVVKNISLDSLAESIQIKFDIIKGATS